MEVALGVLVIGGVIAFRWWVWKGTHCPNCRERHSALAKVCPHCRSPLA